MQREVLRQSPFAFINKLVIIELLFAIIPLGLLLLVDVQALYERTGFAILPPFTFLWTLFVMLLQILAVSVAFISWYLPRYVLDFGGIYYQRGPGSALKKIADFSAIHALSVEQGPLARRLGYGSVVLRRTDNSIITKISDIDAPVPLAANIEKRVHQAVAIQDEAVPQKTVEALLQEGESQFVEFKSSLMWDYRQQRINKKLYTPVMKSLAAFMNSRGGHLLIGVDDEGRILGIEADLQGMRKPNLDGWENTFNLAFNKMIGVEYRRLIDLQFFKKDGKTVSHVYARPASLPIFLKEANEEKFYVRAGNASQPLTFSQAVRYIQARFPQL